MSGLHFGRAIAACTRHIGAMLELRPNCENCDVDLPPDADAQICSFECTFCIDCADDVFGGVCPNCGGGLVARPVRPVAALLRHPASVTRVRKDHPRAQ